MSRRPSTSPRGGARPPQRSPVEQAEYLTTDEARALLRVGRSSFYAALHSGEIPHIRIGRNIRIPRSGLEPGR